MEPFYQPITDFIFVEDAPQRADVIFVPGGNYPEAAAHAAKLYCAGYAPLIVPSGKYSITAGHFTGEEPFETEYAYLREILLCGGVPDSAIVREDRATYTYQNAIFSREALEGLGVTVRRAILCCQAFHARRCLLYYQEQFPEVRFLVCPVVTKGISRDTWMDTAQGIETVLGELTRCGTQFHEILLAHSRERCGVQADNLQ